MASDSSVLSKETNIVLQHNSSKSQVPDKSGLENELKITKSP